jgi:hypothetical protein
MQVLQANKNLATKWNSGSKSGIKWYIIQEENPCLSIFGTTIFSTIPTEYCDHEVYYSGRHFSIFGIAGISTPDHLFTHSSTDDLEIS